MIKTREIEIEYNLKVMFARYSWALPNKLFSDDIAVKRETLEEGELVKLFNSIWEKKLKNAAKKASICPAERAIKELTKGQKEYFENNQEHREIFLEEQHLKFIIQLKELSEEKFQLTQIWYINYPDKNLKTLFINFQTVEEKQQFQRLAEILEFNDEELGKKLILSFIKKFNKIFDDRSVRSYLRLKLSYSDSNIFLSQEEELTAMVNDPDTQAEIAAINQEFAVAEMDGLEGL